MNAKVLIGVLVAAAVAVGAGIYFLGGKGDGPGVGAGAGAGSGSVKLSAAEREKLFWQNLRESGIAGIEKGSAEAPGDEGLVLKDYKVTVDTSKVPGGDTKNAVKLNFKIGEINVRRMDWTNQKAGKAPRWADIRWKKLVLPLSSLPPQAQVMLRLVGIQEFDIGGVYNYTYDPATKTLTVKMVSLDLKNLAAVSVEAKLKNLDIDLFPKDPKADPVASQKKMAEVFAKASIVGFKIAVKDQSLAEKLMTTFASMQGGDVEKFRNKLIQQMEARKAQAPDSLSKEAMDAVIAFIRKPGTISITAAPDKPVPVAELEAIKDNPDAIKAKLKLSIKAE